MNYKVSIIIPIYNVEKYLNKCISSIANQTYKNLEILLVNDGSPDRCPEMCDGWTKNDDRIKVIHKENGGPSDARNAGLEYANGEYLLFVDSDDYIELDLVEKVLYSVNGHDFVLFGYFIENLDENDCLISKKPCDFNRENLLSMLSVVGYIWNKMYKRSFITKKQIHFQKGVSLLEDVLFNEKAFAEAESIGYLNEPLYHYIHRKRKSLVNQYHQTAYELHSLSMNCTKNIFSNSFFGKHYSEIVIAEKHFGGLQYCFSNLFYYKNELLYSIKVKKIKDMLNDQLTKQYLPLFKPMGFKSKVMYFFIKHKFALLIAFIYEISSFIKGEKNSKC